MALSGSLANNQERSDLVAYWSVPMCDGVHTVEFEHGSTSGKRVLRVDGQELFRKDWMFKLVGDETFTLGVQNVKCELRVDPMPHFRFQYSLFIDGKTVEKFLEQQRKILRSWAVVVNGKRYTVVFEKQTLDIWVNRDKVEVESDFVDSGTEMRFSFETTEAVIKTSAEGKQAIAYQLYVDGTRVEEDSEVPQWKKNNNNNN